MKRSIEVTEETVLLINNLVSIEYVTKKFANGKIREGITIRPKHSEVIINKECKEFTTIYDRTKEVKPKKFIKSALKENNKSGKVYNLNSILTFGKYKGSTVESVIYDDPKWINFCIENIGFELDNEAFEFYNNCTS